MAPEQSSAVPGRALTVRHWPLAVAILALLPQLLVHMGDLHAGSAPGSEYTPRVKAILDVSRVAASGGPSLAVPTKDGHFEPVDRKVNDLGPAALSLAIGRMGYTAGRRTLLALNLVLFVVAMAALIAATPGVYRAALAVPFLFTPLVVAEYRSADPLATHGALAVLGIGLAALGARGRPTWQALLLGVLLFVSHKTRSAYALYTAASLLVAAAATLVAWRDRRILRSLLFVALGFLTLELPWHVFLAQRARDPRLVSQDILGRHPIWIALLEGVGWSRETGAYGPSNQWGLRPYDPWMATHLAEHFQLEPVDVGTAESERRSRLRYLELWREAPGHLIGVYAGRLPEAVAAHTVGGWLGLAALVISGPLAIVAAWRDRNRTMLTLLLSASGMFLCIAFQTVILDPRLLYAYPLRSVSLILLSLCMGVLMTRWHLIGMRPSLSPRASQ